MKYCTKCVMPDTRPGIKFNDAGVCYPCLNYERRKRINWTARKEELDILCDKFRSSDGSPDCIIPVSGGKDSHYQTHIMKEVHGMHPLLVSVSDSFGHTKAGVHNIRNLSEHFECDLFTFNLNHSTMRKMVRLAFEHFGSPTWPIDLAIYSVPLKVASALKIPLIVYGENISHEYGGPEEEESPSAKNQVYNNVVKPIDWMWWFEHGITPHEISMISYPRDHIIESLNPIYLSYYYPWDGYQNYLYATSVGFQSLDGEWERDGFIEDYDQIDSKGYLVHPWMKYPKYGHARATDVASLWIRSGKITREEGIKYVKNYDHLLDPYAVMDFCQFTGYTEDEFMRIVNGFFNKDLFEKDGWWWKLKNPIWEQ